MEFLEWLQKREDFTKAFPIIKSFETDIQRFSNLGLNDFLNMPGLVVVHKKNYLFSSRLKELYLKFSSDSKISVAFDFNKNGSVFLMCIRNKELVDSMSSSRLFDEVSVTYSIGKTSKGEATNKIQFSNNKSMGVQIYYYFDGDRIIVTDYKINYSIYSI